MIWAKLTLFLLFIPVEIRGKERLVKKQSYVFVSNHQGAFDIFLLSGFLGRNVKWMMKSNLLKIPVLGLACRLSKQIIIDKDSDRNALKVCRQAKKTLLNGVSLMVFPEGTRTQDGKVRNFKNGAFAIADYLKLPICPLTINGSFEVLPKQNGWKGIKRHRIILTIHKPIAMDDNKDDLYKLAKDVRAIILKGFS